MSGLYAPLDLSALIKCVCLNIWIVYSLIACLDYLKCWSRDIPFSSALHEVNPRSQCVDAAVDGLVITLFISIAILRLGLNGSGDSDAGFDFLLHCWRI